MKTHHDGEVWGLSVIDPEEGESSTRIVTSADDGTILAYNATTHKYIAKGKVFHGKAKKKKASGYVGGASSLSKYPPEKQSRALAYCPINKHIAIANNKGSVSIREVDWQAVDAG